jgi:hypothetical protein
MPLLDLEEFNYEDFSTPERLIDKLNEVMRQLQYGINLGHFDTLANFNARNDRSGDTIILPTIAVDGTAVDHTIATDGSANISFEWAWSGNAIDIDGFMVYVRQSSDSNPYTFGDNPEQEQLVKVSLEKRGVILSGVPADEYYTFGVQAYREVDSDVDPSGIIKTAIIQPSLAGENPYRPSANVAFAGDVTGTINGAPADIVASIITQMSNPFFEQDKKLWSDQYIGNVVPELTAGTIVLGAGATGGKVFEHTGVLWAFWKNPIPVDVAKKYKVRFRVRQTVDPMVGGSLVYAGVATLDANYQNITGGAGTHRYCAVSGQAITVADGWLMFEGEISGIGDLATNFRAGTAYVRPMFVVNYSGGNGTAQVDSLEFYESQEATGVLKEGESYNNVTITAEDGLKVEHDDGSYTQMTGAGIERFVAGEGKGYFYLFDMATVFVPGSKSTPNNDIDEPVWSEATILQSIPPVTVTLPTAYRGKNFKVIAQPVFDWGNLENILYTCFKDDGVKYDYWYNYRIVVCRVQNINYVNGTFEIVAYVHADYERVNLSNYQTKYYQYAYGLNVVYQVIT